MGGSLASGREQPSDRPSTLTYSWTTERLFKLALLAILALACFRIVAPFLGALSWAAIIAISAWPAFLWLSVRLGERPRLAASLLSVTLVVVVVLPIAILASSLGDAVSQAAALAKGLTTLRLPGPPDWIANIPMLGNRLAAAWTNATADVAGLVKSARPTIEGAAVWALAQGAHLGLALAEFIFAIIIGGVLLTTAESSVEWTQRVVAKMQVGDGAQLIQVIVNTVRSVSIGVVGTAFVEGLLAAVGFFIARVPGAALLSFLIVILATVQIPPLLILAPVIIWLYYQGEGGWAVFLLIWTLATIIPVDNFLRPYLISQGAQLPLSLIFVGVIGGLIAWGVIGLFIGPTLIAVAYTLFRNWVGTVPAA